MNRKSYFGIIAIATAMSGAMVLSSCSHDDFYYSEEKAELSVNEKYAVAFENAFGKVGPNVDWGFSSKRANARTITRAKGDYPTEGNLQPTDIYFPSDCDASYFLDDLPEGVDRLPDGEVGVGSYFIDAETRKVSTNSGASKIYVVGTVDLSTGDTNPDAPIFAPDYRSEIYLLKGATLKLGKISAQNFKGTIYIAEGATLASDESLMATSNSKVYNHGSINVPYFEVNTSSFLYNVGTLTAKIVYASSNGSRIVNDGTINSEDVVVDAAAVQNNAEWNATGTTKINSNNSGWVNNGHWMTYDYTYVGGSENVINNCFLEVTNNFDMNISSLISNPNNSFKIDGGGGVVTKNFNGGKGKSEDGTLSTSGPYKIVMGHGAVFKVTETAALAGGWTGRGFFGPSEGEYAVFQAKDIVQAEGHENDQGAVTYSGNLYVSAETHFAQGGWAGQKFIYEQGSFSIDENIYAAGFKSGKPNITIPKTKCSPGFKGSNSLYRVIAEDLSASEAGDFDFNDVVFDVVKAENGQTTLKLICAGGTLPLRVRGASEAEGVEVHSIFGETAPNAQGKYQMYNTGAGPTKPATEFTIEGEYTTPEQIKNIVIEVKKDNTWMPLNATRGEAACKILVDDTFTPVPERQNIADKNKKFTDYVQGKFVDDFWWK